MRRPEVVLVERTTGGRRRRWTTAAARGVRRGVPAPGRPARRRHRRPRRGRGRGDGGVRPGRTAAQLVPRGRQPRGLAAHGRRQRGPQPLAPDAALGAPAPELATPRRTPTCPRTAWPCWPRSASCLPPSARPSPCTTSPTCPSPRSRCTLGVPEGTVKARLARGRAALAELLDETDRRRTTMSELRDLPDLARDVRERVVTPPYDEVSRRVRARRARGAAGSIAAVVLVVGGVAVWQNAATTAGPPAPAAGRGDADPADRRVAVACGRRRDRCRTVRGIRHRGRAVAVVWRALEQPEPTFALVIREADGTVHGRRLDEPVTLTPVPGGWVGVRTAQGVVHRQRRDVDRRWATPGEPRTPEPATSFVRGQYGLTGCTPRDDQTWSDARRRATPTTATSRRTANC